MNEKKYNCNKCETPEVVVPTCTNYCEYVTPAKCVEIDTTDIECIEEDKITLQELAELLLCPEPPTPEPTCDMYVTIGTDGENVYKATPTGGTAPYSYAFVVQGGNLGVTTEGDTLTTTSGTGLIKVSVIDADGCSAVDYYLAEYITE